MEYRDLPLHEHNGKFYFEDPELAKTHDGKSKNIEKQKKFLKRYRLHESAASSPSISYLVTGRPTYVQGIKKTIWDERKRTPTVFDWFDHVAMLYHKPTKSYVLTIQPYDVTLEKFQALEQYCQERRFSCYVDYNDAWWYPGRTPLIVFGRTEVMEHIANERKPE